MEALLSLAPAQSSSVIGPGHNLSQSQPSISIFKQFPKSKFLQALRIPPHYRWENKTATCQTDILHVIAAAGSITSQLSNPAQIPLVAVPRASLGSLRNTQFLVSVRTLSQCAPSNSTKGSSAQRDDFSQWQNVFFTTLIMKSLQGEPNVTRHETDDALMRRLCCGFAPNSNWIPHVTTAIPPFVISRVDGACSRPAVRRTVDTHLAHSTLRMR